MKKLITIIVIAGLGVVLYNSYRNAQKEKNKVKIK